MNDDKRKHLEFIQSAITRMSTNSFFIKGWMVTLMSALFALAAKDADHRYVLVTYFAIPVFWYLDAFYLSQERQYRGLYDAVRVTQNPDYSMDATPFNVGRNTWPNTIFSRALLVLYPPMFIISVIVMVLLKGRHI